MSKRAFTLIEMLVSLAITMMMMGAAVTLFQNISDSVSGSRSIIEMSDRLRAARNRLQADLVGATAPLTPPLRPEDDAGYFEYIEGSYIDYTAQAIAVPPSNQSIFGDTDDILMFTVRSRGEPFIGKLGNGTLESQVAEVFYFCVPNGPVVDATAVDASGNPAPARLCTLYRRVLLVSPAFPPIFTTAVPTVYDLNDLSVQIQKDGTNYKAIPNSLGDLTKRENRFAHITSTGAAPTAPTFPYFLLASADPTVKPTWWPTGTSNLPVPGTNNMPLLSPLGYARLGDDVLLTNVLAFDVQFFDRGAPIFVADGVAIEPRDRKWLAQFTGSPAPTRAFGAYADLGYKANYTAATGDPVPQFNGLPVAKSALNTANPLKTWDTWSLHYENNARDTNNDGVLDVGDEDGDGKFDEGTNGLDDDGDGLVDNETELETLPPYPTGPRGIRVTIRVYEPNSQQVRQVTVVQDFLAE